MSSNLETRVTIEAESGFIRLSATGEIIARLDPKYSFASIVDRVHKTPDASEKKYYFIHFSYGEHKQANAYVDDHPLVWQKRVNTHTHTRTEFVVHNWKELTQEEYFYVTGVPGITLGNSGEEDA